jgi:fructose-1,6-bisphosphatase/inositol monophosphatase family enzyme
MVVDAGEVLVVLDEVVGAVRASLDALVDWGPAGTRPGQYFSDLAADDAAVVILERAGFGVMSEESGDHDVDREVLVVIDPVDGSTNASRGIPWFATSLCALDADGPFAALVVNQATGQRFGAIRGGGAWRDDGDGERRAIHPNATTEVGAAVVLLSGFPPRHLGWKQYRALGAAALDLCAVATGMADAYIDCSRDAHGPWDYLGGALVCVEAGASIADAHGRELVARGHGDRRTPLAAATPALLDGISAALAGGQVTKKG